jgi:hypothetical protein
VSARLNLELTVICITDIEGRQRPLFPADGADEVRLLTKYPLRRTRTGKAGRSRIGELEQLTHRKLTLVQEVVAVEQPEDAEPVQDAPPTPLVSPAAGQSPTRLPVPKPTTTRRPTGRPRPVRSEA